MRIYRSALAALLLLVVLMSCQTKEKPTARLAINPVKEVVFDNLRSPWSMTFISDNEALLAEKDGDLLRLNFDTKERTAISGFPEDLADSIVIYASQYPLGTYPGDAEGYKGKYNAGIMDVVIDPDFDQNHWVYISYASQRADKFASKVIRARLENNTLVDVQDLLTSLPYVTGLFHFGGGLTFGPDGKLYITQGERLFGEALQPVMPIAQDLSDSRGKIYRINPDGSIPNDNPDFGAESTPGLYALGIRASQGLTVDPRNGNIWFSEHGTMQGDEINILEAGANYGWPIKTSGSYRYKGYDPPDLDRAFKVPSWFWHKTIAPTGLTFYTGTDFPTWKNNLIVPGLSRGNLWRLVIEDQTIISVEELFINDRHRTRKAVQSPDGKLYILTDGGQGQVILIRNGTSH